jgi:hypothetical protein
LVVVEVAAVAAVVSQIFWRGRLPIALRRFGLQPAA